MFVAMCRRYFDMEESDSTPGVDGDPASSDQFTQNAARRLIGPTNLAPTMDSAPSGEGSSQEVLASAQQLIAEKQFIVASTMLEKAVETFKNSKDIWILHLQLKSQVATSAELPELYKLFHTAVSSCQSYAVIWEVSAAYLSLA